MDHLRSDVVSKEFPKGKYIGNRGSYTVIPSSIPKGNTGRGGATAGAGGGVIQPPPFTNFSIFCTVLTSPHLQILGVALEYIEGLIFKSS